MTLVHCHYAHAGLEWGISHGHWCMSGMEIVRSGVGGGSGRASTMLGRRVRRGCGNFKGLADGGRGLRGPSGCKYFDQYHLPWPESGQGRTRRSSSGSKEHADQEGCGILPII